MNANEVRKREGLPPVEGGDMPRVQQQMVPLDLTAPEPAVTPAAAEPDAKAQADQLLARIMENLSDG